VSLVAYPGVPPKIGGRVNCLTVGLAGGWRTGVTFRGFTCWTRLCQGTVSQVPSGHALGNSGTRNLQTRPFRPHEPRLSRRRRLVLQLLAPLRDALAHLAFFGGIRRRVAELDSPLRNYFVRF